MHSMDDLWRTILAQVGREVSPTALSVWFDEVVPAGQDGSALYLYCPNPFKQERLEGFYRPCLQRALKQLFSADMEVVFLSAEEYAARTTPAPKRSAGRFSFDSFVVGDSNRVAFQAARAVADGCGEYCNPLILCGPPGVGKTHLLRAIAAAVESAHPDVRVELLRGDEFTNELVDAIRTDRNADFRDKYRGASLFLMDDVQFIAGKKRTQEEFYNTFDTLYQRGCGIVLTTDCPPRELDRLDERILSRFEGGLLAEIAPPEYATRLTLIRRKAEERQLLLPPGGAEYLAERAVGSVRQLEGLLNRLKAQGIAADGFERTVDKLMGGREEQESPDELIDRVARAFRVEPRHIRGKSRARSVVAARQAAMYLLCHDCGLTTTQVGKLMGRDHSTVVYALQTVEDKLHTDEVFVRALKKLADHSDP